jgi:aldehyde:ferredoxin oxidoreductase
MPLVYAGKILRVDLTEGRWREEALADGTVGEVLLGSGLATKLYYDEMDPSLDPLAPKSPLYAFNGLLTGTFAPTGCRTSWCGRSPLTGIWNESNMGGRWGAELRFAGYDGLVLTGRAEGPVTLWIDGRKGTIEIRPAEHLWGKDHFETVELLRAETDPKAQVAGIGPAGENGVRMAGITAGERGHERLAGRGGMGCLMGAKNLKAIAVRGREKPKYHDFTAFREFVKTTNASIKENSIGMSQFGTAGGVVATEQYGDLALSNWRLGNWTGAERITGQRIHETIWVKHTFCFACPIGCGKEVEITDGPYAGVRSHGPEYETLAGFGGNLLNDDLNSIAKINELCNAYSLDTISTSNVVAFALEAHEKGLLTPEQTDGLDLSWGNAEAVVALVGKIARRQGLGDLLADGVRAAAEKLGQGADAFAVHVKGMEVPYHDPRGFVSMAVNYATAARGACHLESLSYWNGYGVAFPDLGYTEVLDRFDSSPEQARLAFDFQNYMSVFNPLGICKFIAKGKVGPETMVGLINRALGWDWTSQDLLRMGAKLFQLKRLINRRLGVTPDDDTLPPRLLTEPRPTGSAAGVLPDLAAMLPAYYELRGWNADGVPTPQRLTALGLPSP